ncbi:MAG: hypothetical protein II455_02415 [Paludibacteraceae bacterium]|nr:hypothetical protein [Paludibacteraceae bacterium]
MNRKSEVVMLFLLKLMMAASIFSVRNTLRRSDTPPHLYSAECDEGEAMFVGEEASGWN